MIFLILLTLGQIDQTNVGGNVVRIDSGTGEVMIRMEAVCYCEPPRRPIACSHYWNCCPDRLSGPGVFASADNPWCRLRDVDGDGDLDLRDWSKLQ